MIVDVGVQKPDHGVTDLLIVFAISLLGDSHIAELHLLATHWRLEQSIIVLLCLSQSNAVSFRHCHGNPGDFHAICPTNQGSNHTTDSSTDFCSFILGQK